MTAPPLTAVGRDRPLPLSFAQRRLWFLDQLEPGSVDYTVRSLVRLPGKLDVAALDAALCGVLRRHEVLRTRLVVGPDGLPYQVIGPSAPFPLPVADISGETDPLAAARQLIAQDAVTPFELSAGGLIRASLIRLAADDHVLALSMHHMVFDEWSARILRRELAVLYAAFCRGEPDPLPPLAVQYADFAVWQRRWLAGEVLAGQLAYWRGRLAGAPVLELPADRPRPPVRSSAGAVAGFSVPAEAAAGLRAVAREAGATMFMTLLAAFAVLLGRYSGQDDVSVGIPVANRNHAGTEDLIGFFVNTLVMRADLSGDPEFTELVGRLWKMALDGYAHQDLPFEQLVDALMTDRDRSRTPLFQVLFNYRAEDGQHAGHGLEGQAGDGHDADTGADPGGGGAEWVSLEGLQTRVVAQTDLRLVLAEDGSRLSGEIEYSTALFDAATIERMAGHLVTLLEGVTADAGQSLSELPVLTSAERDRVLVEWNDTAGPVPAVGGVHELVAVRAACCPDAVAVVAGGVSLTYGGLEERANRLAHYLRGAGVGAESVVGLCLERGVDLVAAMLAVWKAGGVYLPLDPGYPAERLAFMIADSGARVLVGCRGRAGGLADGLAGLGEGLAVVWLDDPVAAAAVAAAPCTPPQVAVAAGQLAYVIYTSGLTGRPKGVLAGHGGLVNRLAWMQEAFGLAPGERVLHKTAITFDVSLWELVWPLAVGGCLVVAEPGGGGDLDYLAGLIEDQRVSVTHFIPSLFHQLARHEWLAPMRDLRLVVCSGEALAGDDVARFYARHPAVVVANLYGPTEASIDVSWWLCERPGGAVPPIGQPIANTCLYVVDRHLRPAPIGVEGELLIGGAGLARGYGRRPGLTAERFIPDGFTGDGSRLYRTGDRARWRADGQLEFLGRIDDQVKIRGFRVEPGEVEAALAAHPGVGAAVVAADGQGAAARLVAWLVPAGPGGGIPPAGELRAFVGQRLPGFMVPAVFTELAGLPLTASGKLDRAALPAPDAGRPELAGGYVAPASPAQELLAGIWAQVLGVDRVGATDSFFDLGGHSLLATQVISRIRGVFGVEVALAALFDQPTVAGPGGGDRGDGAGGGGAAGHACGPRSAVAVVVRAAAVVVPGPA